MTSNDTLGVVSTNMERAPVTCDLCHRTQPKRAYFFNHKFVVTIMMEGPLDTDSPIKMRTTTTIRTTLEASKGAGGEGCEGILLVWQKMTRHESQSIGPCDSRTPPKCEKKKKRLGQQLST
ncbi:hypothetical protein RRG08_029148 [Elysia crispata]|uniref:Uncharacterized protein n=1 Tax=Elysia crispata TaxID=231223 RepID=A0AAE0Y699_9GAST|nr:hypothetical protein RRG08_029148 [Elysia crispata]